MFLTILPRIPYTIPECRIVNRLVQEKRGVTQIEDSISHIIDQVKGFGLGARTTRMGIEASCTFREYIHKAALKRTFR